MNIIISENIPLASFTTMRVGGSARFFTRVASVDELAQAVSFAKARHLPFFVLGGGSNTLVSDDGYLGLVIKNEIKGISYKENDIQQGDIKHAYVTAGAGEIWDALVADVVGHNLWGMENLSLIPGTIGGAVVQNIGAYDVEVGSIIHSVLAFDADTMQIKTFLHNECMFGYRESFFKQHKNFIVAHVIFNLAYDGTPHIDYEDVKKYFSEHMIMHPSLQEIRDAIVAIRTTKMPASSLGTAGSFFKNPVVSFEYFQELKKRFPELKSYLQRDNTVKLSLAWFLDHVGSWRGVRRGNAGVHEKQALILVNYGGASAQEIISLANEMKRDVKEKINIDIEEEVVMM